MRIKKCWPPCLKNLETMGSRKKNALAIFTVKEWIDVWAGLQQYEQLQQQQQQKQ